MSAVHSPSDPPATNSDASTFTEGIGFPSAFVRTEVMRLLQREQEKAVALLETSPLLSYLFFTYVMSAKATPDSPVSDHSEELSALKLRSEKLESELAATQVALTEAHNTAESLREEMQQVKADMTENRSREATILGEKEREKEDLRREAQKYKSESEALQKTMAIQQLETARTKQQHNADKAALQSRLDELQRRFDELSVRREVVTPMISAFEDSASAGTPQSPEQPSTPLRRSQHVPHQLAFVGPPMVQQAASPDTALSEPSTSQVHALPSGDDAQSPDPSPTVRLSKAQKFKAKRAAKKRAQQEAKDSEVAGHATHAEVMVETS